MSPSARFLRTLAIACTVSGLAVLLVCGGAFDGVGRELAARYCALLPELMAPVGPGPNTAPAKDQIAACASLVEEGRANLVEVATYTTELASAAEDGRIDDAESLVLERVFDDMEAW